MGSRRFHARWRGAQRQVHKREPERERRIRLNPIVIVASSSFHISGKLFQRVPVIPGHPLFWIRLQVLGVSLQFTQVVEGVGPGQFRGVDQGHVDVPDAGTVLGLIEEGIFSVQDGLLQRPLADIMPRRGLCRVGRPHSLVSLGCILSELAGTA